MWSRMDGSPGQRLPDSGFFSELRYPATRIGRVDDLGGASPVRKWRTRGQPVVSALPSECCCQAQKGARFRYTRYSNARKIICKIAERPDQSVIFNSSGSEVQRATLS